jgi:hypothetical protein
MWLAVQNRAGELHLVPADEPREWLLVFAGVD